MGREDADDDGQWKLEANQIAGNWGRKCSGLPF